MTSRAIVPPDPLALATVTPELRELVAEAAQNAQRTHAENTRRAYRADWTAYEAWCRSLALDPIPAGEATICTYLTHLSRSHAYASIARAYACIRVRHEDAGYPMGKSRLVINTMHSLAVKLGTRQAQKKALEYHELCTAVDRLGGSLRDVRDRAILLFGEMFGGRRSEISALNVEDLTFSREGVIVYKERSKTDQTGAGKEIAILRRERHCPVGAVEAWIAVAAIERGPLFRIVSTKGKLGLRLLDPSIALVVKKAARLLGYDPCLYAGHSTRRGFVTTAAKQGVSVLQIMQTTDHKSYEQVKKYVDTSDPFAHAVRVEERKS